MEILEKSRKRLTILHLYVFLQFTDWDRLQFPGHFLIDWIRVWQPEDAINIGCSPPAMETQQYIERHWEAYHSESLISSGSYL